MSQTHNLGKLLKLVQHTTISSETSFGPALGMVGTPGFLNAEAAAVEHVAHDLGINPCPFLLLAPERACSNGLIYLLNSKGEILVSVIPQETQRKVPVFIMTLQSDTRDGVSTNTQSYVCIQCSTGMLLQDEQLMTS